MRRGSSAAAHRQGRGDEVDGGRDRPEAITRMDSSESVLLPGEKARVVKRRVGEPADVGSGAAP